jgi:hypothetical protein
MALIPLNTFKTKTTKITSSTAYTAYQTGMTTSTVYTAPVGTTAIILMAQISNLGTQTETVSFIHHRRIGILPDAQGNGSQPGNVDTFLVRDYPIPPNDAANPISGKLILETLDSIRCYGSSVNTQTLQLTLSVLETANE